VKTPPSRDEIEISIFGPGIGEAIVIHVGDNEWLIVDSCIDRISRNPIAIKYLKDLNVNISSSVKLFIVTHWHDDHIRGASTILGECEDALFACSGAISSDEFIQFCLGGSGALMESSGLEEFNDILEILSSRTDDGRMESRGPQWAIADRKLLHLPKKGRCFNVEVHALSPSNAAMTLALREIGQMMPKAGVPKRRVISQTPNHASVALWVIIEDLNILLGSDLENHPPNNLGWKAVLISQNRPAGRALVVKVPHHGSSDAYNRDMWNQMVLSDPIALLTPFASGVKPLPSTADIGRIRKHASRIYCTGRPSGWHPPKRDPSVERTIRETVRTRRLIHGRMGHVRVRFKAEEGLNNPRIELFEQAFAIE
jgi:hypothetical protein